jgi:DNA-binding response OmpR family regulator
MTDAERSPGGSRKVLVVEDDDALAGLLHAALRDEGYAVSVLGRVDPGAVREAVGRLEPDCVLLDGEGLPGYGRSWETAAALRTRGRPVPVLMLTAHSPDVREAREGTSARSRAAALAGVVAKPFDLDELLETVAAAVGVGAPFDASDGAELARTAALVEKLTAAGARDVRTSTRREWANFYGPDGALRVLYWSQRDGVYYVLRQTDEGGTMQQVGRFYDLDAAVALALAPPPG